MFLMSVVFILTTVAIGTIYAGDEAEVTVKHLDSEKGTDGYDLFYYDGDTLHDEKWRFDPKSGSTVVSRRNGFREKDNFYLVDATLDALGSFTKSYKKRNEPGLFRERVREPQMHRNGDNVGKGAMKMSNGFSGVSFNTQYSTQNGFPNVVGIQQINAPIPYSGLNFQQAFSTSGFGLQQSGLFNHQPQFSSNPSAMNNHNFQVSSFLTQFLNQHHGNHNQHLPFGSFSTSIGTFGAQSTIKPIVNEQTTTTEATTTTTTTTTTLDPIYDFDVRLENDGIGRRGNDAIEFPDGDGNEESENDGIKFLEDDDQRGNEEHAPTNATPANATPANATPTNATPTNSTPTNATPTNATPTNATETESIQTTSRRTIEGLQSEDEDYVEGGILDDKIDPKVLLSSVG